MFDIFCGFCFQANPLIDGIGSQQLMSVGRVLSSSDFWSGEKREKVNFTINWTNWMRHNTGHRGSTNKCLPKRRFCIASWMGSPGVFVFHSRKAEATTPEIKMSEIFKTMDRAQQVINKRRDIFRVSIEPIQSCTCDVVCLVCSYSFNQRQLNSRCALQNFGLASRKMYVIEHNYFWISGWWPAVPAS